MASPSIHNHKVRWNVLTVRTGHDDFLDVGHHHHPVVGWTYICSSCRTANSSSTCFSYQENHYVAAPHIDEISVVADHHIDEISDVADSYIDEISVVADPHIHETSDVADHHNDETSAVVDPHIDEISDVADPHIDEISDLAVTEGQAAELTSAYVE
ncbi:hypothetical protein RRG08_064360 [Elysia crispata]|uniref:Uncharacterized protein n=1 Tax=Elysia crispata TaxID=231223 RepID=A0AAE1A6E7_9GAST|nr:hypothetical protein RRG08_064360 [Elysia crispata]